MTSGQNQVALFKKGGYAEVLAEFEEVGMHLAQAHGERFRAAVFATGADFVLPLAGFLVASNHSILELSAMAGN